MDHPMEFQLAQAQLAAQQQVIAELQAQMGSFREMVGTMQAARERPTVKLTPEKPPTFSGEMKDKNSMDVRAWAHMVRNYFQLLESSGNYPSEVQRIQFVGGLLRQQAADWYYMLSRAEGHHSLFGQVHTMEELLTALTKHFEPVNANEKYREKLSALKQTSSVSEYVAEFMGLACKVTDLSAAEMKDRFMRGLKMDVRKYITPFRPVDMAAAAELAGAYDVPANAVGTSRNEVIPMEIDALQATLHAMGYRPRRDQRPIRSSGNGGRAWAGNGRRTWWQQRFPHLSLEEYERLRQEKRCLNCKQQGHQAKACPQARR